MNYLKILILLLALKSDGSYAMLGKISQKSLQTLCINSGTKFQSRKFSVYAWMAAHDASHAASDAGATLKNTKKILSLLEEIQANMTVQNLKISRIEKQITALNALSQTKKPADTSNSLNLDNSKNQPIGAYLEP